VGEKEFWGLSLKLNDEMLVPRPESETVVEAALDALGTDRRPAWRMADLGTGSGALLLALLAECPAAFGVGTDVSVVALAGARANARRLGLADGGGFVACECGAALRGPYDVVVSNPPYVCRDDIVTLQPEVRRFDPARALDGGPDGLDGYRAIAADARRLLTPDGLLLVELGVGQFEAVGALFAAAGLAVGGPRYDFLGVPRGLPAWPFPLLLHHLSTQKIAWIVVQDRLGFCTGIDPRRSVAPTRGPQQSSGVPRREDAKQAAG